MICTSFLGSRNSVSTMHAPDEAYPTLQYFYGRVLSGRNIGWYIALDGLLVRVRIFGYFLIYLLFESVNWGDIPVDSQRYDANCWPFRS